MITDDTTLPGAPTEVELAESRTLMGPTNDQIERWRKQALAAEERVLQLEILLVRAQGALRRFARLHPALAAAIESLPIMNP